MKWLSFIFNKWLLDFIMLQGRTTEELILVGLFFFGMMAWWYYDEFYKD